MFGAKQQRQLAHVRELPGDEVLARARTGRASSRRRPSPSAPSGAARSDRWMWQELPSRSFELRHERERHARPGRRSPWRRSCRSTWLSQVVSASAYRNAISCWPRLHSPLADSTYSPAPAMRVADPAQQRLDPGGAEHRVVDVVLVGRGQVAVAACQPLVGVVEDDELQLGADERRHAARRPAARSAARRICRGEAHDRRAVLPARGRRSAATVPGCHGTRRSVARSGAMTKSP